MSHGEILDTQSGIEVNMIKVDVLNDKIRTTPNSYLFPYDPTARVKQGIRRPVEDETVNVLWSSITSTTKAIEKTND